MPLSMKCPYCRKGKVRAPRRYAGRSVACPACAGEFLIEDTERNQRPRRISRLVRVARKVPRRRDVSCSTTEEAVGLLEVAEPRPSRPKYQPPSVVSPVPPGAREYRKYESDEYRQASARQVIAERRPGSPTVELGEASEDLPFLLALAALILGGIGLMLSQAPYGIFATLGLAFVGILLGSSAWMTAHDKTVIPRCATALNVGILLVSLMAPGMLGSRPLWSTASAPIADDANALDKVTGKPLKLDWIDTDKAVWQRGDVRVSVISVTLGPVDAVGPDGRKRKTAERLLQVRIRLKNVGVSRRIPFEGWPAAAVALTDGKGVALASRRLDPGWDHADSRPVGGDAAPGKSVEQVLLFEPPSKDAELLKLILPGSAVHREEPIRFRIARATIVEQR